MSQIIFKSKEHRDFFLEMMSKCKVNDCYHRAFFYVMGIAGETSVEKILRLIAIVNLYTSEYLLIN